MLRVRWGQIIPALLQGADNPGRPLGEGVVGSGGQTRTGDLSIMSRALLPTELRRPGTLRRPDTAQVALSLLRESNSRPFPYHGNALPTELRRRAGDSIPMRRQYCHSVTTAGKPELGGDGRYGAASGDTSSSVG